MTLGHLGPQEWLDMCGKKLAGSLHLGGGLWGFSSACRATWPPSVCSSGASSDRNSMEQRGQNEAQWRNAGLSQCGEWTRR